MKQLLAVFCIGWLSLQSFGLDIELNTQLDKKLKTINKTQKDTTYEFNILRQIEIKGLETISEGDVRNQVTAFIGDKLDPFTINRNIKQIQDMGFFETIDSEVEDFEGGKKWIITIRENPTVEVIIFDGNTAITDDQLMQKLESKTGEIVNVVTIRKDIRSIEKYFNDEGYLFTKVNKVDIPTYEDKQLVFHIEESHFNNISVSGNTKTKEYVILREIDIKPEDQVNENVLKSNLKRVFNLNYFSEVVPDIQPSTASKNAYDLIINVEEKSTDSVNFGGGWGQRSGGFLYSDLNINNLMGTGQLVSLRGQWGSETQLYQFKYHNPWMFGKRKSLTYRAWNSQGNYGYNNFLSTGYRPEMRYGMDVAVGLPHSYSTRSRHRVKTEKVSIDEYDDYDADSYSIQSYTYSLSYDTRDVRFNPLNGIYSVASIENGFKFQSDSLGFTKYDLNISNFYQTFDKQTIATRVIIGKINGEVESTEYYFIGGPNTVRGYEEYPNSFAYGRNQLVGNIEYRFLLSEIFQLLFFLDAGWASSYSTNPVEGKVGKGVGFRINSPLGPIRIDFGIDELGDMRTHFNIGQVF